MKKRMIDIMNTFHKYNTDNMAYLAFGLDAKEHYDALVVAPSFSPYKLKMDSYCKVTTLREGAYIAGGIAHTYLKDSIKDFVPFEKVEPEMNFVDKVVDVAKQNGFELKKASVFCTPSIATEYYHLDEIKEFDTDLIEMETASLYLMADLLEVPTVALLVVSDNSATGAALVGRTEAEEEKYANGRHIALPQMILKVASI